MAGTIYGTVKNQSGQLITAAVVSCPGRTVVNNNGAYSMSFSSAGTYTLTAAATGYVSKGADVTVSAGAVVEKNFVLTAS
jgi:hypothetical protein